MLLDGVEVSQVVCNRKHFLNGALCKGTLLCWNRKGSNTNCWNKVGNTLLFEISLYALWFPFIGTKGPRRNLKKKTDEKLHWTTASEIWTYSVSSGRTNPVQLLSGSALSPALSQTKQRQPPDSTLLRLTFSQGGRFLQRGVNEGDVARTSHRGVCCVRRAADGENDRKQLLGLFQENDSHSPLLSQVV